MREVIGLTKRYASIPAVSRELRRSPGEILGYLALVFEVLLVV